MTEVQQLGPRLALEWVTIHGLDVDAVATNTVKAQERRNGASIKCFWCEKNGDGIFTQCSDSQVEAGAGDLLAVDVRPLESTQAACNNVLLTF